MSIFKQNKKLPVQPTSNKTKLEPLKKIDNTDQDKIMVDLLQQSEPPNQKPEHLKKRLEDIISNPYTSTAASLMAIEILLKYLLKPCYLSVTA